MTILTTPPPESQPQRTHTSVNITILCPNRLFYFVKFAFNTPCFSHGHPCAQWVSQAWPRAHLCGAVRIITRTSLSKEYVLRFLCTIWTRHSGGLSFDSKKLTNSPAQSVPRAWVHCRSIRNSPSLASAQERRQPVGKENGTLPPCRPDKPDTCTRNINKIKIKQEINKGYNNQQWL